MLLAILERHWLCVLEICPMGELRALSANKNACCWPCLNAIGRVFQKSAQWGSSAGCLPHLWIRVLYKMGLGESYQGMPISFFKIIKTSTGTGIQSRNKKIGKVQVSTLIYTGTSTCFFIYRIGTYNLILFCAKSII